MLECSHKLVAAGKKVGADRFMCELEAEDKRSVGQTGMLND